VQGNRVTTTFARHDVGTGVKQDLHNLQESAVRSTMEWSSPDVGVLFIDLRRISRENAAYLIDITAASSGDQSAMSLHHYLLEYPTDEN
jgi:hypothetical protein